MRSTPPGSSVPEIVLETERLRLRTEAEGDQAIWLAHMNTAQVTACLGGPRTAEEVAESFTRKAEGWARHGYSFMMIERRDDGLLIGHCGLAPIETECAPPALRNRPQIGWTLRADCWGQGYAMEAARAVLAMAFDRLEMPIVFGQTSQSNAPSWSLMEKLRMERLSDLDYADPDYPEADNPTMVYAITRAGWRAQTEPAAQ